MGNENSTCGGGGGASLFPAMVKQHFGPSRKMSKAQSSSVLAEISSQRREESSSTTNSPASAKEVAATTNGTTKCGGQRKVSGAGGYIKKQQQRRPRQPPPPPGVVAAHQRLLEKRGSLSSSSGGSQDYSGPGTPSVLISHGALDGGDETTLEATEVTPLDIDSPGAEAATTPLASGTPLLAKNGKLHNNHSHNNNHHHHQHQQNPWLAKHRKDSGSSDHALLSRAEAEKQKRIRSTSLCATQMKADCQAIANISYQHALANDMKNGGGRKSSSSSHGVMPPLTRLRIQQCFRNAKPAIGHQILKRAGTLRPEFKSFLGHLREEKTEELANDIFALVTECVANVELPSKVAATSFAFGEMHAQLCQAGFRPEFFSVIADATIAECVRLDGGAQKRCETLLAWSQMMQFMFSNVRDGYYAEIRQQRRSSLPQQRLLLKQVSMVKQQQQQLSLSVDGREREDSAIRSAFRESAAGDRTPSEGGAGAGAGGLLAPSGSLKDRRRALLLQQNISFDMDL